MAWFFKRRSNSGAWRALTLLCSMSRVPLDADPADAKWRAIEAWGSRQAGSTPLLWLDKACIDQQRIDESLAALPVYLSGCNELLIVVGPTYTRRLWCMLPI